MGKRSRGGADDLRKIVLADFSGGVNSQYGALSLGLNESVVTNTINVIGYPGRAKYVGGFTLAGTLPGSGADGACEFFDSSGTKHEMVWLNGNLYQVALGGVYTLVKAAVYTAGEAVAHVDQAGVLYYTSPTAGWVRKFDGTTESQLTGTNIPKGGSYMTAFAGSILIANPVDQTGVYQPAMFVPSAVNDPTNWLWADAQTVGTDYNGIIAFIMPMGVSSAGISPTKSIIVGKTRGNLFMYTGAIGSQSEALVNCPVGCLDGLSAVYVPAPSLYGQVIFLGTDGQLWGCDGVIAEPLTQDKNLDYVYGLVNNAQIVNPKQRFCATYNDRYSYYLIDLGSNQQLIWMWRTKSLFPVKGWPSGMYYRGTDKAGFPCNFVAASKNYSAGLWQVGQDFTTFNSVFPDIVYQTAYLHAGDSELQKEYPWCSLVTRNLGAEYQVIAQTMPDSRNNVQTSKALKFLDPAGTANSGLGIWDQSQWDNASQWAPDAVTANPAIRHCMLSVPVGPTKWIPNGSSQPLRSGAATFIISAVNNGSAPAFDIIEFSTRFAPRSRRTSGNDIYQAESSIITGTNPWVGQQS